MADVIKTKNFNDSYLYNKGNFEGLLFNFIMKSEVLDKSDESFLDIKADVKRRQVSNSLVKILDSKNVILLKGATPLPRSFKVFVAKDLKGDKKTNKVYIDVSDLISGSPGSYKCRNVDILIAYLVNATTSLIYYLDPKRILMKNEIIKDGSKCFSALFTHVIDYLYKISNLGNLKNKCIYLSSMYYLVNILDKDIAENTKSICRANSGLSEREEEILLNYIDEDTFSNIKTFVESISDLLRLPKLTLDVFLERWVFVYGTGTQYALELFPSFASMLTNVYVGCYLNNQKTIEKITGNNMVNFSIILLKIGSEAV